MEWSLKSSSLGRFQGLRTVLGPIPRDKKSSQSAGAGFLSFLPGGEWANFHKSDLSILESDDGCVTVCLKIFGCPPNLEFGDRFPTFFVTWGVANALRTKWVNHRFIFMKGTPPFLCFTTCIVNQCLGRPPKKIGDNFCPFSVYFSRLPQGASGHGW